MKTFLQAILPTTGYYSALVISKGVTQQKFFSQIDDIITFAEKMDKSGDVYVAVGSFEKSGSRKHDNVLKKRAFYLDVDCGEGKPYTSQAAGMDALVGFLRETKLPKPMVVSSGRGLHVYWLLSEDINPTAWTVVAKKLQELCVNTKFEVDPVVTADSARILRIVGTTNKKNNGAVRVITAAQPVDVIDFATAVSSYLKTHQTIPAAPAVTRSSSVLDSVEAVGDMPSSNSYAIESKCAVIADAIKNPNDVSEPLWYKIVGLAAYTSTPEETAIRWSKGHADFDEQTTLRKMEQFKNATSGAPLCSSFASLCKQCAKCPFRAKGATTPWVLGIVQQEVKEEEGVLPLPKPYKRTKNGIFVTVDGVDVAICDFDIYPVRYGKDEQVGTETVHFKWYRKHYGWADLIFPNYLLYTNVSKDFVVQIGGQGILLQSAAQTGLFQTMLRDYIIELRNQAGLTNIYTSNGWKENDTTFVIGDTVFVKTEDGFVTEKEITFKAGISSVAEMLTTAGSAEEWIKFTEVLHKYNMPIHQFALGVSFSAPLYHFTGLKGGVLSLYGETGGGKTLAQKWMQSVWGNPEMLHFASTFTPNALYSRMSTLGNLPMTIDEATKLGDEFMGDFVYTVTQGRDKARLTKSANEMVPRKWELPVVMSTNISLVTKLSSTGFASDAQMLRLLELEVPVNKMFTASSAAGREIHNFLTQNHGHIGRAYIKHLLQKGAETIKKDIDNYTWTFPSRFGVSFQGTERYWEQLIVLAHLGLVYAKEAGLIRFEPEESIKAVVTQLTASKEVIEASRKDVFDNIADYCSAFTSSAVTALYTGTEKVPYINPDHLPRDKVVMRYNIFRENNTSNYNTGTLYIDSSHLKKWLAARGVDYRTFMKQLDTEGINATPEVRSQARYCLGKHTPLKSGQVYTIRISLNHPRLSGMIDDGESDSVSAKVVSLVPDRQKSSSSS